MTDIRRPGQRLLSSIRFRESVARHGVWPSLVRKANHGIRRIVDFEVCRVEADTSEPYDWPDVLGYATRMVTDVELHKRLCAQLDHLDCHWAFAQCSACAASFHGREIVGVTFSTSLPTRVRDGVDFVFPPEYVYSFASLTAPSHRGRRLEQDRWEIARRERINVSVRDRRSIWYVNATNLESRATGKAVGTTNALIGYAAWGRLAGRNFVFNSPGCRRAGAGFARERREWSATEAPTRP